MDCERICAEVSVERMGPEELRQDDWTIVSLIGMNFAVVNTPAELEEELLQLLPRIVSAR